MIISCFAGVSYRPDKPTQLNGMGKMVCGSYTRIVRKINK